MSYESNVKVIGGEMNNGEGGGMESCSVTPAAEETWQCRRRKRDFLSYELA